MIRQRGKLLKSFRNSLKKKRSARSVRKKVELVKNQSQRRKSRRLKDLSQQQNEFLLRRLESPTVMEISILPF